MPMRMTEEEYQEMRRKSAQIRGGGGESSRSQNVKLNGKPVPDNRGIPANQQARRDLNKKLREQQKPTKKTEHPILTKARRVAGKVHGAIQKTTSRYVEGSNEANRRHEAMRSSGRENVSGTWVTAPIGASKKKTANDNYSTLFGIPSSVPGMSGLMSGGFGIGSSLPRESTNTRKKSTKKKKKNTRRGRY